METRQVHLDTFDVQANVVDSVKSEFRRFLEEPTTFIASLPTVLTDEDIVHVNRASQRLLGGEPLDQGDLFWASAIAYAALIQHEAAPMPKTADDPGYVTPMSEKYVLSGALWEGTDAESIADANHDPMLPRFIRSVDGRKLVIMHLDDGDGDSE